MSDDPSPRDGLPPAEERAPEEVSPIPAAPDEDPEAVEQLSVDSAGGGVEPDSIPPGDTEEEEEPEVVAEASPPADEARRELSRITRRSLVTGTVAAGAAYGGWRWLTTREPLPGDRLQWSFRRVLEANERIARAAFSHRRRAKEWPLSKRAPRPRVNGRLGLDRNADPSTWSLRVEGLAAGEPVELDLAAIRALPRVEMVTELRCIEGWSEFVHWGGARLADLARKFPPATRDGSLPDLDEHPERVLRYVALETPDRGYWVGLDLASALHPQTLLAYEINGAPLTWDHGAPLRLVIPVKYGIKHLKRIGVIRFTDTRPPDYWAERKYDWYAGL